MIKPKIAQFILSMDVGGAERLVRVLSRQLKTEGVENCVCCFDKIEKFQEEFAKSGVPLRLIKRRPCVFDWKVISPLMKYIKEENVGLIHAHDLSSLTYAVVAGKLCGTRIIMTEHSRHYVNASWKRRMEKWLFVMAADCLVEVSQDLKTASMKREKIPAGRIEVIENGVDIDAFKNADPLPLHQLYNIDDSNILILSVGRLETIKGQQYLIRAMAEQSLKALPVHLILVGEGSQKNELIRMAEQLEVSDRINFLGSRQDIPELMASCDLFVIPSESEGLPFVLLEAIAAGLPVISTEVGGIPAIIGENERGVLVPPCKPDALSAAIQKLLNNKGKAHQISINALQFLHANYSQQAMLIKYKRIYEKLLGFKPSSQENQT